MDTTVMDITMDLATDTTAAPLTTFTLFNYLPAELRLEIWRLSCSPRVVDVRYSPSTEHCHTTTKPPAIVQVNSEARVEGQMIYERAFQTRHQAPESHYIYFHPDLDILYLPRHGAMGYDDSARDFGMHVPDATRLVRSLAVDHVPADVIRPWEPYNKLCLIRSFPNVDAAFLVIANGEGAVGEEDGQGTGMEIEFVDPRGDPAAVMRLIDAVLESFCYELGLGSGVCSEEESQGWMEPPVSLIPKAKILHTWADGHGGAISCS